MTGLFILDTVAFINYFNFFFNNEEEKLTPSARAIIDLCFDKNRPEYKLSIPNVVFIEVFEKFLKGVETVKKFKYEIMIGIENNEDVEIKPIDKGVLENFILINDNIIKLEYHDKLITASALQLNRPLITCDSKIREYIQKSKNPIELIF